MKEETRRIYQELKNRPKHKILADLIQARNRNNIMISYIEQTIDSLEEQNRNIASNINYDKHLYDDENCVHQFRIDRNNCEIEKLRYIIKNLKVIKECL